MNAVLCIFIYNSFISKVYNFSSQSFFFLSELLLTKQLEYFQSWVYPFSHELIVYSIRSPLVSGFYKLLSVAMIISKKINYYQVIFLLEKTIWINFGHFKYMKRVKMKYISHNKCFLQIRRIFFTGSRCKRSDISTV